MKNGSSPSRARVTESHYFVLKKMKWNNRKFYPPRFDSSGRLLSFDTVKLPAWAAEFFWYGGVISEPPPTIRNAKAYSPLDLRFNKTRTL